MDLLIILTYTAICIAIFKIFRIPLNKWSVPTAVLGGVIILSALLLIMNYNHPYAKFAKEVFTTIPIVPQITGTVKTVDIEANQFVKKGTLLFTLENTEQQLLVEKANADYIEAKSEVLQKSASLNAAIAFTEKERANRDRTKASYLRFKAGHELGGDSSPFSEQQIINHKQAYEADEAALNRALADEKRLRLITESKILGENTQVAQLHAVLDKAKLDLERTFVRAPVDGIPTQLTIRPGVRATSFPLRPVIVFIPKEKRRIAAAFWQNSLLRLEKGLEAEVVLDAVPGKVFTGRLVDILPAMAEGEAQSAGSLIGGETLLRHGFVIGVIELDEDLSDYNLPLGVQGQAVALNYDHDILHVSVVRRILLRMMAWLKYVYPIK
jgi:multidrug resistance efflux pump